MELGGRADGELGGGAEERGGGGGQGGPAGRAASWRRRRSSRLTLRCWAWRDISAARASRSSMAAGVVSGALGVVGVGLVGGGVVGVGLA